MQKRDAIAAFCLALLAPLVLFVSVKIYFDTKSALADKYECYPFEACIADFDNDGLPDSIEMQSDQVVDSNLTYRLKFFTNQAAGKTEVLNIQCNKTDGSFRTHVALLSEEGRQKVVIYDTINEEQYFFWNGEKFVPSTNPSLLERDIRYSLGLNDDTGGMHIKILLVVAFIPLSALYYFALFITAAVLIYRRRREIKLP